MGDVWVLKGSFQVLYNVHGPDECWNFWCTIHHPMPGPWDDWPMIFRSDRGFMERVCPHGIGHPAIEDVLNFRASGIHGCDGCCKERNDGETVDLGPL